MHARNLKCTGMTIIGTWPRAWFRSVTVAGSVALLCGSLVACSGSSTTTSRSTAGSQAPVVAPSSNGVGASTAPIGASSATGNGTAGPCSKLTQAEAGAAVGQTLNAGVEDVALGSCTYTSSDYAAGVVLTIGTWDSMTAAAHGNGANPSPVTGVGDEALNNNGSNGSQLYVRKGTLGFLIVMNGPNIDSLADHGLAKEEAIAAVIMPRL